jgi:hypothetical protein
MSQDTVYCIIPGTDPVVKTRPKPSAFLVISLFALASVMEVFGFYNLGTTCQDPLATSVPLALDVVVANVS